MRKLVWIYFIFISSLALAQDEKVRLQDCYEHMLSTYPIAGQVAIHEQSAALKTKNIKSAWLPNAELKAQATYQSDVFEFDLDIPFSVDLPEVSKDQYKASVDINQMIYDWGRIRSAQELEKANLMVNQQSTRVELNKLKEQVNKFYFAVLILQKNEELLQVLLNDLNIRQNSVESAVKNGVMLKSDLSSLKAEIIKVKQNIREIQNQHKAMVDVLSEITGMDLSVNTKFEIPEYNLEKEMEWNRPELTLFDYQKQKLQASSKLISKQNRPSVFAFAQLGYGKPGLNMMQDEFDSYYIAGIGLSWKFWDWNKTKREKQVIHLNKEFISTQENSFTKQLEIALKNEKAKIKIYEEAMESDEEIIALRQEVSESARSKLDNGVITSTDYITEVTKETQAKISYETHKIQLVQAKVNYLYIKGEI